MAERLLTRLHRLRTPPLGGHNLPPLVQAGRIGHDGHEKQLQGRAAAPRLSQSRGLWSGRAFLRLPRRDRAQAPLGLATRTEQSALGSSLRGQHKSPARLLQTLAHPRAQALHLLEEGQFGRGMLQGVGDTMAHIADPRGPLGGLQEGIDEAGLALGAAVTPHVCGPPTALETREENRADPCPVPWLAQAQAHDLTLLQRPGCALAAGRDWDPQDDEGFLAPTLHRTIGAAHPLCLEGALRLWEARAAEPSGPPTTCRQVRHPGEQANRHQLKCLEHSARRAERQVTVQDDVEIKIAQKNLVWSMAGGGWLA